MFFLINTVLFTILGAVLAFNGLTVSTGSFWAVMLLVVAIVLHVSYSGND